VPARHQHDSLFAKPLGSVANFRFDQAVVDVFPDMLKRSIPGYQSIIAQSGLLAARFAQKGTRLYDLGCSLGATSLSMQASLQERQLTEKAPLDCRIVGVDNSTAMIDTCQSAIDLAAKSAGDHAIAQPPIQLQLADIQHTPIDNASVVALNFTLQFVPVDDRDALMQHIAAGLVPGGALILSEKVKFADAIVDALHIEMYHAFKAANGYSDLEISQKRTSLENVLVPDTLETHTKRLTQAGFSSSSVWFQCFNFASIVAIKS